MNVALAPELQKWVETRVESGLYTSSSEVVAEALRLMVRLEERQTSQLAAIKTSIDLGLQSAEAGRVTAMSEQLIAEIKQLGRTRRDS
jgi:antitoxin ParD1/3/4